MKTLTIVGSLVLMMFADTCWAQNIGVIPDGVTMGTTPVVSADGRYVRIGVNVGFTTLIGFQPYSVPGAVSGGGGVGFGAGAGANGAMLGPNTQVFTNGPVDYSMGMSSFGQSFEAYLQTATDQPAPVVQRQSKAKSSARIKPKKPVKVRQ